MALWDANEETFEQIEFQERPALFTSIRINRSTLPEGIERYELRHSDEDGDPVQIARSIFVNHFGTILVNEPIQLPPDGYLDISAEDLNFGINSDVTLKDYIAQHPPKKNEIFELVHGVPEEHDWFYDVGQKGASRGYLGHLEGSFDENGTIHTNFISKQTAVQGLQSELKKVTDWLKGEYGPLRSSEGMAHFCSRYARTAELAPGVAYGFRIDTPKNVHYLRCLPTKNAFTLRSYDRAARQAFLKREARRKSMER